jgi:hypothetical protein
MMPELRLAACWVVLTITTISAIMTEPGLIIPAAFLAAWLAGFREPKLVRITDADIWTWITPR